MPLEYKSPPTIPCRWCAAPTRMLGTKECDRCWNIRSRLLTMPLAALNRMLSHDRPEIFSTPEGKD